MSIDQFTRWLCPNCGLPGIDSWNKAMFDGRKEGITNPLILGDACHRCLWPVATCYTAPDAAPTAILSPAYLNYAYEDEAFRQLQHDPASGIALKPSDMRDSDWSRGCLAAQGQLQ